MCHCCWVTIATGKIFDIGSGSRGISKTYNLTWYCSRNPLPDHRHQPTSLSNSSCMQYSPSIISSLSARKLWKGNARSPISPYPNLTFKWVWKKDPSKSWMRHWMLLNWFKEFIGTIAGPPWAPCFLKMGSFPSRNHRFSPQVSFFAKFISHMEMLDSKGGE